jgi:regulator of sigma D
MLTYEDFKAKPKKGGMIAALANVSIDPVVINQTLQGIQLTVTALFNTELSWMKEEAKGEAYVLNHEQGHFDIFEIFARRCRKALTEAKLTNKTAAKKVSKIVEKNRQQAIKYQDKYDEQTQHSLKVAKQEEWNKKIAEELKELEAFSSPILEITY